jgi:hypothetical protein
MVVVSVPANVRLWLTVNVLPSATAKVELVAGAVIAILLMLVAVATPNTGVTNVGVLANTNAPVPVSSVTAARKLALEGVAKNIATLAPSPLMPVDTGKPVQFVNVPDWGIPRIGVANVALVNKTALLILLVTPLCSTGSRSVLTETVASGSWGMVTFAIINPSSYLQRC